MEPTQFKELPNNIIDRARSQDGKLISKNKKISVCGQINFRFNLAKGKKRVKHFKLIPFRLNFLLQTSLHKRKTRSNKVLSLKGSFSSLQSTFILFLNFKS